MYRYIKAMICLLLVMIILGGCKGDYSPVAKPYVEEMIAALSSGDLDAATVLMHPEKGQKIENLNAKLSEMSDFLDGRQISEIKQQSVKIYNSLGTDSSKTDSGTFRLVMTDESVIIVEYSYVQSNSGSGFAGFYISVGT